MPVALLMACASVLALAGAAPAGAPEGKLTVAVLEIKPNGVEPRVAAALLDIVAEEVGRAPHLSVLSRKEIESILNEEARQQMTGCDSTSCLAEMAGALDATFLITGEAARVGDGTLITLQLINQRFATVVNRVSLHWPGKTERLPEVVQAACQLLVLEREQRRPGSLVVQSAPPGSRFHLDEKPLEPPAAEALEVGVHSLRVSAAGYEERSIPFVVRSGATARVNGSLVSIPLYRRTAFWMAGGLGTGAAAAGVATVLVGIPSVALLSFLGLTATTTFRARSQVPQ